MNGSDLVLRLEGITKRYGAVTALHELTLGIRRGEFFTLLGPSGSGKSTTLLLIAGFQEPSSGELYLQDRPLSRIPPHKRQIGVVFQSYAVSAPVDLRDVAFALRNLRWPEAEIRAQVATMLSLVQLTGYEDRLPAQLSGGQQRRAALARALAFRPPLLLLDEPIGALDRELRERMLVEFRRVHRTLGTTMIYVTHDQEEALVMSEPGYGVMAGPPRRRRLAARAAARTRRTRSSAKSSARPKSLPAAPSRQTWCGSTAAQMSPCGAMSAAGEAPVLVVVRPEKIRGARRRCGLPATGLESAGAAPSRTVRLRCWRGDENIGCAAAPGRSCAWDKAEHHPWPCFEVGRDVMLCLARRPTATCCRGSGRASGDDIVLHDLG